jgi:hypothetical protein
VKHGISAPKISRNPKLVNMTQDIVYHVPSTKNKVQSLSLTKNTIRGKYFLPNQNVMELMLF